MQRIDSRDQRLIGWRPARGIGAIKHGGADLDVGQMGGLRKRRDMHAPFVIRNPFARRCGR